VGVDGASTAVLTDFELLAVLLSESEVTVAVLTKGLSALNGLSTSPVMLPIQEAPGASVPTVQVMVNAPVPVWGLQSEGAPTISTPAGISSVITTLVAFDGPRFSTNKIHSILSPSATWVGPLF
jgi:hypothetical protein